MEFVLNNNGCLLMVDDDFMAEVKIEHPDLLNERENFSRAKQLLFKLLQIETVLVDIPVSDLAQHRKQVVEKLESVLNFAKNDWRRSTVCIQLMKVLDKFRNTEKLTYFQLFLEIEKEKILDTELKELIEKAKKLEKDVCKRFLVFSRFGYRLEDQSRALYKTIEKVLRQTVDHQKNSLMEAASDILKSQLDKISRERLMLAKKKDVKLFSDMRSILNKEIFLMPLQDMEKQWVQLIQSMEISFPFSSLEITNDMLFFLCKSLQELILEISELTGIKVTDLLNSTPSGWQPISKINWKEENLLTKCLERQYYFMFRLLNHFAMRPPCDRKTFQYKTKFLSNTNDKPHTRLELTSLINRVSRKEIQSNHFDVPDEIYVWYCLLDDVHYNVLSRLNLSDTEHLVENYLDLVRASTMDQLESLRVATHDTIRFMVAVIPYISTSDSSSIDRYILQKQLSIITITRYRDVINVFNSYWKSRNDVIPKIVSKIPLSEMSLLKDQLLNIVSTALDNKADNEHVVEFFRTYEEFIINLNEVPFDWYIKYICAVNMKEVISKGMVKVVDNRLKDTDNASYQVIHPKQFEKFCSASDNQTAVPKHYVIDTLKRLFSYVDIQLRKEIWASGDRLTEEDKLSTTCEIFVALQQLLLFMREQPEYTFFEKFYDESVEPFASLVENSESQKNFSKRVRDLKESYWFFRKQNDITVDKALLLYKKLNSAIDPDLLKNLYQAYSGYYEHYIQTMARMNTQESKTSISQKVKELISEGKIFTTWDRDFKQKKVPQILAYLAAVWSTLVSKDISSSDKYLSPHCIQIFCTFQLLSAEKEATGIDKHLAQVLTGQGKSLILALVAALLALTGHKVDIGCYSKYLVKRDRDNFNTFYTMLNIDTNVTYGTLDKMMEKFVYPQVNGHAKGLRELVKDLLLRGKKEEPSLNYSVGFTQSVLLIDEVDVFFSEHFFGTMYAPALMPMIKGLDEIQVYIWNTVSEGLVIIEEIVDRVWRLIEILDFPDLKTFINRNHEYELLSYDCERKMYTNRRLFKDHLIDMINCAVEVFKNSSRKTEFKLNASEIITYNENGEYVTTTKLDYYNIFNYFLLKKDDFIPVVNGCKNYGYLNIRCGTLSYAMLPIDYSLILGVSGTLTDLNEDEKKPIREMYGVQNISASPTFFGSSNLRFDKDYDFKILDNVFSWKQCIFSRASQMVEKKRAVLVFFETDVEIEDFKSAYGGQIDRLNLLTENTDDKEKYTNEAGIAGTVTLATRGMGRGVDYKSSVMVEKNGGVHVIQTFFSMDIKEERQIRGRTARQDNNGSYEIVLCRKKVETLLKCTLDTSYSDLEKIRRQLFLEANNKILEGIENNKSKHNNTMRYLKSFFKE